MKTFYAGYSFGPYEGDLGFTFQSAKSDAEFRSQILDTFIQLAQENLMNEIGMLNDEINAYQEHCDKETLDSIQNHKKQLNEKYEADVQFLNSNKQQFLDEGHICDHRKFRSVFYKEINILQF